MPRGDRTGPEGYGAMTGRGLGYCAAGDPSHFAHRPRLGGGFGRGWRRRRVHREGCPPNGERFPAALGPQRTQVLKEHAQRLREEAESIEKEIEQMRADEIEDES